MRWSGAAALGLAGLATAHRGPGAPIPHLVGLNHGSVSRLQRGWVPISPEPDAGPLPELVKREPTLKERQNTSGQCGVGFGSCAPGYCCSSAG